MKTTEEEIVCYYGNLETGEVDYELRVGDSLKLYTREQKEYNANHRYIKKNNTFVKVYKDNIEKLLEKDLTKCEYKIILVALKYLDMTSGILVEDGVNIGKQRLIELTGLSHNTLTDGVNHLTKLKIMAKTKSGKSCVYLMNPFIFMNGSYINDTLYKIFKKSEWNTKNE